MMAYSFEDKLKTKGVPAAPPKSKHEQPGGLRSETSMVIQTRQAQKIVVGRKRSIGIEPIIGLLDFGRRMKLIWLSSEADDPYADWYLIKIEHALQKSRSLVGEKKDWLDSVLKDRDSFDIQVATSIQPVRVPIYFQNPYGYMGAYLVADYDALARAVFTARHIGLIDRRTAENILNEAGKAIRRTFVLSTEWKFTGIVREDLIQLNQAAQRAMDVFGECPADILTKENRAKMAPNIKTRPQVKLSKPNQSKEKQMALKPELNDINVTDTTETVKQEVLSLATRN